MMMMFGPGSSTGVAKSVTGDCQLLGTCLTSATDDVNTAMKIKSVISASAAVGAKVISKDVTSMSLTINDCATLLTDRLQMYDNFNTMNDAIWDDVSSTEKALSGVESAANDLLKTESGYATQMTQLIELFQNTSKRSEDITRWIDGEKVLRNQLTDIYNTLDGKVLTNSNTIVVTASAIRDALIKMQKVHDHATQVLTAVGDAETELYEWAFNVTQTVNSHTVDLVSIAQTLQYRSNQLKSVTEANTNLNWVVSQLAQKYGKDKLVELSNLYDSGNTTTPSSNAQGLDSTSKTSASTNNTIAPA